MKIDLDAEVISKKINGLFLRYTVS